MMDRISSDHLSRQAFVYIRQSTPDQLRHNHESRRRQYGLTVRARKLGWGEPVVIDEDLGRSGGGTARPGFERLLLAICEGRVGIVLALEASRLARNGRDWHTLLEFCGLVGCLLADEEGVYDPRLPNDRLLLGMKGTLSELELSTMRQRSLEALRQKARRGELLLNVAVGYVKVPRDRIVKDPDRRVQEAVSLVFRKFSESQSVRQVHLWLRQEEVLLPAVAVDGETRRVVWKPPVYNTIHHMLTNPVYGGAYAFGRTGSRVTVEGGRKRVSRGHRRDREAWDVLIVDHHEGYVSWEEFERNQRLIADNANCKGLMTRGAVRRGDALLAGLLRCGHCGRRLHVSYTGTDGYCVRYSCRGAHLNHGTRRCISFGGVRVDSAVGEEVLRLLSPLGIEASVEAVAMREDDVAETRRQMELALTQARYEADLARRQYDAVDPQNRLVAAELERRWNEGLAEVARQEERLAGRPAAGTPSGTQTARTPRSAPVRLRPRARPTPPPNASGRTTAPSARPRTARTPSLQPLHQHRHRLPAVEPQPQQPCVPQHRHQRMAPPPRQLERRKVHLPLPPRRRLEPYHLLLRLPRPHPPNVVPHPAISPRVPRRPYLVEKTTGRQPRILLDPRLDDPLVRIQLVLHRWPSPVLRPLPSVSLQLASGHPSMDRPSVHAKPSRQLRPGRASFQIVP